jgi:serine/threonine protein kinase/CheY-like chemotaxis protein
MEYIQVLLVEQEPDTISLISLSLSEIKECQLEVCSSAEEALMKMPELKPDLILLAHGLLGKNSLEVVSEMVHKSPSIYLLVSLPESNPELADRFLVAGVKECIVEDKNYVPNLVAAVKKALIAIAERDEFELPQFSRAEQMAMDENLPDVVFSLDLEGKIVYVNRAISTMLGYEQKDVVGTPFIDFISDEEGRGLLDNYLHGRGSQFSFVGTLGLQDSLGISEDFDVNFTLMEGESIYGVARKQPPESSQESLEEIELTTNELDAVEQDVIPARMGPYRVVTLLGAGAMGRVYRGLDEQLDRPVAIKVLNKALASDREHLERFRQEAKILASINHPNIALIYYFGSLEDTPFFCMEFLQGGSLDLLLQQKGILDPEIAVGYTLQAALGLNEAIEKGVIHLDVKPSNLMLAEKDRLKLVDFGLARKNREQDDQAGTLVGTPLYIAPEQIHGGVLDFRCDIYSLGITFFQMLYGFVPHSGLTLPEIFKKRLYEDLPPRESLPPAVPARLYEIVRCMTARDPDHRYGSYAALIADLERARRDSVETEPAAEVSRPAGSNVRFQGALYDHPFAEILSEVLQKKMSGKLTLSWIDLYKNVHFKNGKITAVLSNQEGESFLDLLIIQKMLTGKKARSIQSGSTNLFLRYSAAMQEVPSDGRDAFGQDMQLLAWKILEGLFSWVVGEYFFEEGDFPDQITPVDTMEALRRGVMEWVDSGTIRRRILDGHCRITTTPEFRKHLRELEIPADHRLIAFRIGDGILFSDLLLVAGVREDQLFRILYLFHILNIISLQELKLEDLRPPPKPEVIVEKEERPAEPHVVHLKQEPSALSGPAPAKTAGDLGTYYYQCAVKSYTNKNYWAAVEYCKKAIEHKKDSKTYQLMGKALATHPAFKHEAMEAFKQALDMDPTNELVERDIADLYYSTGNYALAKTKYLTFLKLRPSDEHANNRLEEVQKKTKKKGFHIG